MTEAKRRGRPPKARLEGETYAAMVQGSEIERAAVDDAPAWFDGEQLAASVEAFKARFPDKWDELRLCPLQHGIEEMIACLNS
jgi:hypothetical protein